MIIVSNGTKPNDWAHILTEAKLYLDKLGHDVEIRSVDFSFVPREEYQDGKWGINKAWLKSIAHSFQGDHERFIFHDATFKVEGTNGWFSPSISTPSLTVKQLYRPLDATRAKYNEFNWDVARTLVHELCHSWAYILGIKDETHKYQQEDNLMAFVDKIVAERKKGFSLKKLFRQKLELLKRIFAIRKDHPIFNLPVIVHHSASSPDETVEQVIGWSDNWYHTIIRHGQVHQIHNEERRGYQEICVIGQFEPTYTDVPFKEPSEENLYCLDSAIYGREYMGHNEARTRGVNATRSKCPGVLLDRFKEYMS